MRSRGRFALLAAALVGLFLLPPHRGVREAPADFPAPPPSAACASPDNLRFSSIFTDNLVLDAASPSRVWGWLDCGTVSAALDGERAPLPVRLDGAGLFVITLLPRAPSTAPRTLTVRSGGGSTLRLLLRFGRVYFCSGQSNMVGRGKDSDGSVAAALTVEESAQRADAESVPLPVYTFRVGQPDDERAGAAGARAELPAGAPQAPWAPAFVAGDGGARDFSAVCWWMGRAVAAELGGVPVGLIEAAWGGSAVQAWSTPDALTSCAAPPLPQVWWMPGCPSCFWNSHVAPFVVGPFSLSGVALYIGETNALFAQEGYYACGLPRLLKDLGRAFGGFPWAGVVELAPWESHEKNEGIARVREAQLATARRWRPGDGGVGTVTVAPAGDCGDPPGGIHPRRKRTLGLRLGRAALARAPASGPAYLRAEAAAGGAMRVYFAEGGTEGARVRLALPPPECPEGIPRAACMGMEVQLSDGGWRPAAASVEPGGAALLLRAAGGEALAPVATRSGWAAFPLVTVLGAESGLPAHPWSAAVAP